MKKLFIVMLAITSLAACNKKEPDTLHLICRTTLSETDPTVKEQYDVTVKFLDDGAILTVDGTEYKLEQDYDNARVSYHRWDPWYNFQIGNRNFGKYALGIPSNEGFARYTKCKEK